MSQFSLFRPNSTKKNRSNTRKKITPFIIPVVEDDVTMLNYDFVGSKIGNQKQQAEWIKKLGNSENYFWKALAAKEKNRSIRHGNGKNIKWNKKNRKWLSYFRQFFSESSLHGLHYLVKDDRSILERILWLLTLCLVYGCCAYLIKNSVENWLSSPVIMSMENQPTSVAFIPFPAVTVCDTNQIKPSVFNISAFFAIREQLIKTNINQTYLHQLEYASILCRRDFDEDFNTDILNLEVFHYMMNNAHQKCQEIYSVIKWTNETYNNPCDFIQPVLTEFGMCYSFNMLPLRVLLREFYFEAYTFYHFQHSGNNWSTLTDSDWYPHLGYKEPTIKPGDIPRRTSGAGSLYAYRAYLNLNPIHYDPNCNAGSAGFAILVHSPADIPLSTNAKVVATEETQLSITVNPETTRTSRVIEGWKPKERGCYLDHERELFYFKLYTQSNCHLECESNYSLTHCGCVAFYHPRSLLTPVCGSTKMDCVEDSLVRFAELITKNSPACNCLPACATLLYESSVTPITRIKPKTAISSQLNKNMTGDELNVIGEENEPKNVTCMFSVSYGNRDTLGTIRRGVFTFSDFLGNIGGILGLFLGFSWISLVEIVYFLCLKPIIQKRKSVSPSGSIR